MRPSPMRDEKERLSSPSPASTMATSATSPAVTVTTVGLPGVIPWSTMRRKSRG